MCLSVDDLEQKHVFQFAYLCTEFTLTWNAKCNIGQFD